MSSCVAAGRPAGTGDRHTRSVRVRRPGNISAAHMRAPVCSQEKSVLGERGVNSGTDGHATFGYAVEEKNGAVLTTVKRVNSPWTML